MSLRYVLFRENSSSHEEEYLARANGEDSGIFWCAFCVVSDPALTNLQFESAAEAYEFAGEYHNLQHWRVGLR